MVLFRLENLLLLPLLQEHLLLKIQRRLVILCFTLGVSLSTHIIRSVLVMVFGLQSDDGAFLLIPALDLATRSFSLRLVSFILRVSFV